MMQRYNVCLRGRTNEALDSNSLSAGECVLNAESADQQKTRKPLMSRKAQETRETSQKN